MLDGLNLPLILLCAVLDVAMGGLWWVLFGAIEQRYRPARRNFHGITPFLRLVARLLPALLAAFGLALVLENSYPRDLLDGLLIAAATAAVVIAATTPADLIARTPWPIWVIRAAYRLTAFLLIGALLTLWG